MTSSFISDIPATAPAHIIEMAQALPSPRVAIARAGAPLPMAAAKEATEANMMVPLFTGERRMIEEEAEKLDWDISGFEIIEAEGEVELFFVPIKPGKYTFECAGLAEKGMTGTFIIE